MSTSDGHRLGFSTSRTSRLLPAQFQSPPDRWVALYTCSFVSGLIDGDPGPDQEAIHQERDWDASMDLPPTNSDRADADLVVALDT